VFLKEGEVLYKLSLKDALRKEVEGYLSLAEHYLDHAKEDFKRGDYRIAADIGYNSLELTLRAMGRKIFTFNPRRYNSSICKRIRGIW